MPHSRVKGDVLGARGVQKGVHLFSCSSCMDPLMEPMAQHSVLSACHVHFPLCSCWAWEGGVRSGVMLMGWGEGETRVLARGVAKAATTQVCPPAPQEAP